MLSWLLLKAVASMEREFNYDASYLRHLAATDASAFRKFSLATLLSFHRKGVPAAAWHAAKITTAKAEDCGPCTQLLVDMALKDGVAAAIVTAVLKDDAAGMGPDAVIGWRLARGVSGKRHDAIDEAIGAARGPLGRTRRDDVGGGDHRREAVPDPQARARLFQGLPASDRRARAGSPDAIARRSRRMTIGGYLGAGTAGLI